MSAQLSTTNPYLRDSEIRERTVVRSVATSSGIEGIRAFFKQREKMTRGRVKLNQKKS
jgi:hypothetical protein